MSGLGAQILGQQLVALVREAAASFAARSRSALVLDEGQYACAILDGAGRLLAQDQGEPSHLAAVQATVARMLDAFAFDLSDGDVLLAGDAHCGGTWGGVLTLALPLFHDGDLRFLAALRFAVPDLAGELPGPFQPAAHEIWQESLRITPVKLVEAGAPQRDLRRYLLRNSRTPRVLDNDLAVAGVVAAHVGARLAALIDRRGLAAMLAAAEARIAYSAARAAAHLGRIAPAAAREGDIALRLAPRPGGVTLDLTGSAPVRGDAANLTLAATRAVVLTQLAGALIEDGALAQGLLDAAELRCPPDCLLDARAPAAVSLGWRVTAPVLATALARATGEPPAIGPAAPLLMLFEAIGSVSESRPWAVSPGFVPVPGCAGSDAAAGRRRLASVELAELDGRISVRRRELTDSGLRADLVVTGSRLEAIAVPGAAAPRITRTGPAPDHARLSVLTLEPGACVRFDYPAATGGEDAGR